MKILLIINGQDFAPITAQYALTHEVTYDRVIQTMDGAEHPVGRATRDIIELELFLTFEGLREDYKALTAEPLIIEYDDPDKGAQKKVFRLDSDLSQAFQMHSAVFHTNIYKSGPIRLRALEVDR